MEVDETDEEGEGDESKSQDPIEITGSWWWLVVREVFDEDKIKKFPPTGSWWFLLAPPCRLVSCCISPSSRIEFIVVVVDGTKIPQFPSRNPTSRELSKILLFSSLLPSEKEETIELQHIISDDV